MYTKYLPTIYILKCRKINVGGEYSNFHLNITDIAIFNSATIHITFNKSFPVVLKQHPGSSQCRFM